jgi:hypothetical protein
LKGKDAVRAYWQSALMKVPDLHFELIEVLVGVHCIAIHYNAVLGKKAVEVLFLNEAGKAYKAVAHYSE